MTIYEYIEDSLRSGKTPEELAAEITEAIKNAETARQEEEARAAEAAKTTARNGALKALIDAALDWFDNYAPEANMRAVVQPNIDYNELAEAMIELASGLQTLSVLTHVMPQQKTIKGQRPMTDDEALKIFLSSMGI